LARASACSSKWSAVKIRPCSSYACRASFR
jgi:hypothetical protein